MIITNSFSYAEFYHEQYGADMFSCVVLFMLAFAAALMLSLSMHEMAHGIAAKRNGDLTALEAGRLTLNPLKHFDIMGTLMMLLVGFGWAKPVPITPANFYNYKKGMFQVATAGIITNIISAFFISLLISLFLLLPPPTALGFWFYLYVTIDLFLYLSMLFHINFFLFNLLPIFPLDGFRVLESFLPYYNRFMIFMRKNSSYILLGLILLGFVSSRFGMDFSPLTIYISYFGTLIRKGFSAFWALFGLPAIM